MAGAVNRESGAGAGSSAAVAPVSVELGHWRAAKFPSRKERVVKTGNLPELEKRRVDGILKRIPRSKDGCSLLCAARVFRFGFEARLRLQRRLPAKLVMILGLTGGMGCGKTTAARLFEEHGFGTIDSDAIVHELLANDGAVVDAVAAHFGPGVLDERGAVDRRRLGARVFADSRELKWLEDLLHPLVGTRWRETVSRESGRSWVVQIPLLFEKKLEQSFDFTVCVGTSPASQRRRLLKKGFSDADIARRISRQLPLHVKTARADFFLLNDGSLEFLREQVERLHRDLASMRESHAS